jgi:hypothetical protein
VSCNSLAAIEEHFLDLRTELVKRFDPVVVVAAQRVTTFDDADVICRAFHCSPLDVVVPVLGYGI